MSFTIAIPTFDRNDKLFLNLSRLLPLIKTEKLIILDNHSAIPVQETLRPLLQNFPEVDIIIYRHKVNIGLLANFLRCFELCETKWMWLLSDDDPVYDNCLQILRRDIEKYSDYSFFNYASSMVQKNFSYALCVRNESFVTKGVDQFLEGIDSFPNLLFVSSGVYNLELLLSQLRIGYTYAYSLAPHIAMVLTSLNSSGKVLFSNECLVNFTPPAFENTWSMLTFAQSINILLEIPVKLQNKSFYTFFNKVNQWSLNDYEILIAIENTYKDAFIKRRYIFTQIIARTILKKRNFRQWLFLLKAIFKLAYPKYLKKRNYNGPIKDPLYRL